MNGEKPVVPEIGGLMAEELSLTYVYHPNAPFDGELKLSGRLGRKGLCYMMLELARSFIKDFDPEKQGGILIAKGLRGLKGGQG